MLDTYRETVGDVQFGRDFRAKVAQYAEVGFGRIAAKDANLPTRALVEKYIPSMEGEAAEWKIKEEMAAQYFAGVAGNNMDKLVERLERTGGRKLVAKVREVLEKLVADIRAALNRLSGRDEAVRAALHTAEDKAGELLDLFNKYAERTREARTARLTEQGERIREEAVRAESGVRSAESRETTKNSRRSEVLTLENVDWMDDFSSIKDQLEKHKDEIAKLKPVAIVNYGGETNETLRELILKQVKSIGGERYVRNGVSFLFDANAAQSVISHARSDKLRAAALAAPFVAKKGILIAGHQKHENHNNTTLTYAAPAIINGSNAHVGVVIQFTNDGRAHAVNIEFLDNNVNKKKKPARGLGSRSSQTEVTGLPTNADLIKHGITPAAGSQEGNGGTRTESRRTDAKYMAAVERGDMDAAQEMVDEAAKAAGYDSPRLYHGTGAFGFTEFDLDKGEHAIFASSNLEVAKTYVGETDRMQIAQRATENIDNLKGNELLARAKKQFPGEYDGFYLVSENEKNDDAIAARNKIRTLAEKAMDLKADFDGAFNAEKEQLFDSIVASIGDIADASDEDALFAAKEKYESLIWDFKWMDESLQTELSNLIEKQLNYLTGELDTALYKGNLYRNTGSAMNVKTIFDNQLALELDAAIHKGVYQLYGKMVRPLQIDANGANWNDIRDWIPDVTKNDTRVRPSGGYYELVEKRTGNILASIERTDAIKSWSAGKIHDLLVYKATEKQRILNEGPKTTRFVSTYAFNHGYDSVVIRNLRDVSTATDYRGTGDIYIFNAKNAVKSADPVTYDDKGNVIPLSERFNAEKEDIRYSRRTDASLTVDRIDYLIHDSGAGSRTDYARSWITSINPTDFINLTTKDFSDRSKFDTMPNDYGTAMDDYDYMTELKTNMRQTPYLAVDLSTGEIVGHEGRHRMRALEREGITSTPVRIEFRDENGYLVKEKNGYGNPLKTIASFDLKNQFGNDFTAAIENIIPLMKATREEVISAYGQENAEIRWSKRTQTAREEMDAAVVGGEMLGQMLDAARDVLHKAHSEIDKAAFDAWLQGEKTGGKVAARKGIMGVVKKYNDPQLTGVSHEELTDRIVQGFMDLKDYDFGADELVYTVIDAMAAKAAGQSQSIENETREIIRDVTAGRKFIASDKDLGEITGTLGLTRGQLNRTLKQVYGFTLVPASRTEAAQGLEYLDVAMDQVAEALPNLFEGSSLFENSTADNGNAVNRVVWLYENRDQMEMEERTQGDELGLYKYDPDSDEALEATMTLYERAYQEAANFAEDLIRLSPVHTVADAYDGTMSELRQATRGMMQRRAREIEAIREQIETAEAGLNMAAQTNAALTQEAAKKQRRIDSLTDQLAVAERDARRARDAGDEKAAALEEKVGGLKEQIAELKKQVKAERDKVTRRDVALLDARADRDARLKAQREYYAQKRHEGVLQRQDTALKQRLRKQIVSNVLWLNGRFTRPSDQQHIPEELKHVIAPFIEAFAQNEKTAGWYAFKRNQIDDLLMFYERLNADDARNEGTEAEKSLLYGKYDEDVADMLRALKTTIDGKKITELASAELSMIDSIMANLRKMVADANTVFLEGRNVNFSQSAGRFIAETQAKAKTRSPLLEKIRKGADGININMAKPIYLFKEIVGGEISKYFDEIREAQNRWAFMVRDSARAVQAIQEKYHYKDWKKDGISFTFSDGYTAVLTKDAVLQIYATYKREIGQIVPSNHLTQGGVVFSQELDEQQTARALRKALKNDGKNGTKEFDRLMQANREKIASKAHHLTPEDILRLGRTLTPEQMQYADAVVKYLSETVSEWGNRTSMELYGYKKFLERYYFPFQSSDLYLHQSIGVTNDARIKNKGFTKMLQKGANNPIVITGFSEVAAKHIGEMASYSALTAPLENMNRLLQYSEKPVLDGDETVKEGRSVKDALMAAYGGDVYKYMHTFLTQMNGGVKQDATAGMMNKLTGNFKRAAVALNFSVMVQQPSAVARAMAMVDPKYFVRSTANWFDYKELEKWSGVAVIKSFGGFDTDVGRSTTSYILGESTAAEKIGEITGWGAEKMDAVTWSHIWNAVKRETAHEMGIKYRRKGMSEKFYRQAAARFNEVADYTQVYDSTISRSQWMRSQDTGVKMATAFMAEPTTTYNMLLFSGMKKNGKAINKGAAIGAFAANVILNTALQSLIGAWRDKEDESYWERYFRKLVQGIFGTRENLFTDSEFNILNMVPFIKDVISLFQGYDVERSDMSAVSELLKALEKIRKAYDGREDDQALWDFIKENSELLLSTGVTLSNFTGLPLKSMYRDIWQGGKNAIEHLREGDYHTTAQHLVNIWKQTFEGEWDKNEQLYYAVIQGDKELLDRMVKVTEEDYEKYINSANNAFDAQAHAAALKEKTLHTQIAEALVEMDGRIADAAKAVYAGDVSRATALADAVAKDGFDLSDVNHAIQLMGKQLYPNAKEYSDNITQYALVTNDMLDNAYGDGNKQAVVELRDALIEQGKSADTVNQRIGNMIDEDFATGEIGLQEAKAAYDAMTTFTDEKKQQRLTKQAGKLYENDGSMSYDALRDVYLQIGVTEEKVGKQMADVIVNDYVDGKFDGKAAAVEAYMKQTGETDEQSTTLKFDYEDAKARDENYPLTFSNYKKYVESGLEETGVSVAAYDQFLTATKNITSSTTSAGWEAYSARMASVKSYNKFTTKQYHYVQAIEETFDTVEQKDAAYRATAAAENWSLAKLPLTPWH